MGQWVLNRVRLWWRTDPLAASASQQLQFSNVGRKPERHICSWVPRGLRLWSCPGPLCFLSYSCFVMRISHEEIIPPGNSSKLRRNLCTFEVLHTFCSSIITVQWGVNFCSSSRNHSCHAFHTAITTCIPPNMLCMVTKNELYSWNWSL